MIKLLEPNWRKAHSILLPYFNMRAMQDYFPKMVDIAEQLVGKWERLNPDEEIDVPADMTRLTLDTIGLCGFDYRFNSFYRDTLHPFVEATMNNLEENQARQRRLPIQDRLMIRKQEVDRVLGTDTMIPPTYAQVHQLQYITQILSASYAAARLVWFQPSRR